MVTSTGFARRPTSFAVASPARTRSHYWRPPQSALKRLLTEPELRLLPTCDRPARHNTTLISSGP